MKFSEIISMAMQSLGANKLRSGLTMMGITIGVFSVISVMTAIGALQSSIESGISFLGSNIFQFAKYPVSGGQGGRNAEKYENRRNVTYAQGQRYVALMQGIAREVCLKTFDFKGQAVYNGLKTTAQSDSRRVEPEFSDREQLLTRLRTKYLARRRGSRPQRGRHRQGSREEPVPA